MLRILFVYFWYFASHNYFNTTSYSFNVSWREFKRATGTQPRADRLQTQPLRVDEEPREAALAMNRQEVQVVVVPGKDRPNLQQKECKRKPYCSFLNGKHCKSIANCSWRFLAEAFQFWLFLKQMRFWFAEINRYRNPLWISLSLSQDWITIWESPESTA